MDDGDDSFVGLLRFQARPPAASSDPRVAATGPSTSLERLAEAARATCH